jgi:hypothetical protein
VKFGAGRANRRFQFEKRRQRFIRAHNETLSIVAKRVSNPDCSPFAIPPLRHSPQVHPAFLRLSAIKSKD